MRSASVIASTWSWVTKIIVAPSRRCSRLISTRIWMRSSASRLESGSSKRKMRGSRTMARPIATRWRWPPESWPGLRSRSSPICRISAASRILRSISARAHAHGLEAEGEVLPDAHVRVERVGLEDHGELALGRRHLGHVCAVDEDVAAADLLEAGDHPEQRRLAAAGGADEDDELAVVDLEVDAVDHLGGAEALHDLAELEVSHARPRTPLLHGVEPSAVEGMVGCERQRNRLAGHRGIVGRGQELDRAAGVGEGDGERARPRSAPRAGGGTGRRNARGGARSRRGPPRCARRRRGRRRGRSRDRGRGCRARGRSRPRGRRRRSAAATSPAASRGSPRRWRRRRRRRRARGRPCPRSRCGSAGARCGRAPRRRGRAPRRGCRGCGSRAS